MLWGCWFMAEALGEQNGREEIMEEAAQTECARYNPKTREFEWTINGQQ